MSDRLDITRVDRVWLFAPRDLNGRESGLLVISLFLDDGSAKGARELATIRYEAEGAGKALRVTDHFTSQGSAPADRIPRLIEGVLDRLGDQREEAVVEEIGGDPERWSDLLARASALAVD